MSPADLFFKQLATLLGPWAAIWAALFGFLSRALYAGVGLLLVLVLTGCAGSRASHTDAIIQALTAGESQSQALTLPPAITGAPVNLIVPSVPGKNVEVDVNKGADGSVTVRVRTYRDVIVNAILAGAMGLDAQKFAEDAAQRAFFEAQLDKVISIVQPILDQRLAQQQTRFDNPTPAGPTQAQRIAEIVEVLRQAGINLPVPPLATPAPQ